MVSRFASGTSGLGSSPVGKTRNSHIASLHRVSHPGLGRGGGGGGVNYPWSVHVTETRIHSDLTGHQALCRLDVFTSSGVSKVSVTGSVD